MTMGFRCLFALATMLALLSLPNKPRPRRFIGPLQAPRYHWIASSEAGASTTRMVSTVATIPATGPGGWRYYRFVGTEQAIPLGTLWSMRERGPVLK